VETRNITLSLPVDLIRQAKVYSAEHDITMNALVRELLRETLSQKSRVQQAAQRFLQIAEGAPHSAVNPKSIRRDELHQRD